MKLKDLLRRSLVPVTAGAVVLALAAGGIAYASMQSAAPSAASAVTAASVSPALTTGNHRCAYHRCARHSKLIGLLRHTVYAQLVVRTAKGDVPIVVDRGTLTVAPTTSAPSVTVTAPIGAMSSSGAPVTTVTATITSSTRFPRLKQASLAVGDHVVLVETAGSAMYVVATRARAPVPVAS